MFSLVYPPTPSTITGRRMSNRDELLPIVEPSGLVTGIAPRSLCHGGGMLLHPVVNLHVIDRRERILLQKRSEEKESFPGMYDTSSAGHIPAGVEPMPSALRELSEELGITAASTDLKYAGTFRIQYQKEFHGRMFRDNEVTTVYVYDKPVDISSLTLQASEVSEVRWFDLEEVWNEIKTDRHRFCVPTAGLNVLREYLKERGQ